MVIRHMKINLPNKYQHNIFYIIYKTNYSWIFTSSFIHSLWQKQLTVQKTYCFPFFSVELLAGK